MNDTPGFSRIIFDHLTAIFFNLICATEQNQVKLGEIRLGLVMLGYESNDTLGFPRIVFDHLTN